MKKLSIMLAMALSITSFSANALQVTGAIWLTGSMGMTTMGVLTTSGKECGTIMVCKLADQIAVDADVYFATGKMTELLAYKVSELKESAGDMSDLEAVEILADFAHRTLELY
jgi:hypothetical protein